MHDVIITQEEQGYLRKENFKTFLMNTITFSLNYCTTKGLLLNFRTSSETQTYSFLFQRIIFPFNFEF